MLDGRSFMSVRLYPGTLPGKSKPFCSVYVKRNRTTYSVDAKGRVWWGFRLVLPWIWGARPSSFKLLLNLFSPTLWSTRNILTHTGLLVWYWLWRSPAVCPEAVTTLELLFVNASSCPKITKSNSLLVTRLSYRENILQCKQCAALLPTNTLLTPTSSRHTVRHHFVLLYVAGKKLRGHGDLEFWCPPFPPCPHHGEYWVLHLKDALMCIYLVNFHFINPVIIAKILFRIMYRRVDWVTKIIFNHF